MTVAIAHEHERLAAAIRSRSTVEDDTGCWIWGGSMSADGYGRIHAPSLRQQLAHRVSHIVFKGPIPEGLTIDHLCRQRACVNPEHLEAVTVRENTLRGDTLPALEAAQTRCLRGHDLTDENVYRYADGRRDCRRCRTERRRAYYERNGQ